MQNYWEGPPFWPSELTASVAEILMSCREQLVDFAADEHHRDHGPQTEAAKSIVFERYLELDEETLQKLLPHQAERAREIGAESVARVEALLTDEQLGEFRTVGFRTLLARLPGDEIRTLLTRLPGDARARVEASMEERGVEEVAVEEASVEEASVEEAGVEEAGAEEAGVEEADVDPAPRQAFGGDVMRKLNRLPVLGDYAREDYSEYFCSMPFEHADIAAGGKLFLCCALWLPEDAGTSKSGTFMEVWNSEKAQDIRRSILDGSYSKCLEQHCPHLQNKTLPKRTDVQDPFHLDILENNRTVLDRGPSTIVMSYDKSCNLACRTCRVEPIMLTGEARAKAETVQEWATGDHLKDARQLDVTLSGDAFGSPVFFKLLREFDSSRYPELRISLCTNGILLTERNWNLIANEAVDVVYISIDAATPETYAVNRGGDFARLLENLRFVGKLRKSGDLKEFTISFVVQANNFHEMPAFVELGQSVNVDSVMFIQVGNHGVFTPEEFQERAVHVPTHPDHHELLRVLEDPRLGAPVAELRNFSGLRAGRVSAAVESVQAYLAVLDETRLDGKVVVDSSCLPSPKDTIRAALTAVLGLDVSEAERTHLTGARELLSFFQPGVGEGRTELDSERGDGQTWRTVVKTELGPS